MRSIALALGLALGLAACSSSSASIDEPVEGGGPPLGDAAAAGDAGDAGSPPQGDAGADAASDATTATADPTKDGPYAYTESDAGVLHIVAPTAAKSPVPVVLIAPGYMIPPAQYLGYAKRLASHGIAAATVKLTQPSSNQKADADELSAALDALGTTFDTAHAGVMGHSRGGKGAVLAAAADARFRGVLALDPVDSKPPFSSCDATSCPDGSDAAKTLKVPSGFLGETLDGTGSFQACAPTADNYATFYASAAAPSFIVTVTGAGHMSFIDDPTTCGFVCSVCKAPTRAQAEVLDIAYAYAAAFFLQTLRGDAAQATFLAAGADASK